MAGTVLGLFLGMAYIGWALEAGETITAGEVYLSAPIFFGLFWLVGLLFTRTLGITAMFGMLGAAVSAVVALVSGAFAFVPAFLLHAAMLLLAQHGLKSRLAAYEDMSTGRRLAS